MRSTGLETLDAHTIHEAERRNLSVTEFSSGNAEQDNDVVLFVDTEKEAREFLKLPASTPIAVDYDPLATPSLREGWIITAGEVNRIQVRFTQKSVLAWRKELGLLPTRKKEALVRAISFDGLAKAMMTNAVR
jgi:hypothetical protein